MKVDFSILPNEAKLWMYQSSRPLTNQEKELFNASSEAFLSSWESHGIPVQGSIDLINDHFIRVAAYTDEPSMCGRAQDAQVRLAKELEQLLGIELTNRMLVAFEDGGEVTSSSVSELDDLVKRGEITTETIVFNNLVNSKADFEKNWKLPIKETWLERYF